MLCVVVCSLMVIFLLFMLVVRYVSIWFCMMVSGVFLLDMCVLCVNVCSGVC